MRAGPVPETTKARLEYFVESSIVKDSKVYAGGDGEYGGLANRETVNRGNGGYVRERCPCQRHGIVLGLREARVQRDVPPFSPKRLHLYVAETAERLNIKDMHALDKVAAVGRNMVGRTLTYKQLITKNALCGV